ncbi:MAG TPA: SH3 domain-containing protein [Terriglobales bacterium]
MKFRSTTVAFCLASTMFLAGCNRGRVRVLEIAYVSAVQANLRERVAAMSEKAGEVKNGERVEVLDHDRHFVKVRTASGATGWIEQRFLIGQKVYDEIQQLTADNQNDPVQARGITRNDTNLHVEPGRNTEHLYQISTGEKLALLKRGTAEKPAAGGPTSRSTQGISPLDKKPAVPATPASVIEDWWLVRDSNNRVGWVLARMVDLDVPLDIAQYAEGQRIVAFFVLNQVQDGDKKVAQYLTVLTEPKDGLPFDFNQIRVFSWNVRHHRYETAYHERVEGILPVTVSQENFDKDGLLPVFVIQVEDDKGDVTAREYKFNTPIVRRVYAPGEEQARTAKRTTNRKH